MIDGGTGQEVYFQREAEVTGFGDVITRQRDKGIRDISQVFA